MWHNNFSSVRTVHDSHAKNGRKERCLGLGMERQGNGEVDKQRDGGMEWWRNGEVQEWEAEEHSLGRGEGCSGHPRSAWRGWDRCAPSHTNTWGSGPPHLSLHHWRMHSRWMCTRRSGGPLTPQSRPSSLSGCVGGAPRTTPPGYQTHKVPHSSQWWGPQWPLTARGNTCNKFPALSYGVQGCYSLSLLLQLESHPSGYWCLDGTRAVLLTTFLLGCCTGALSDSCSSLGSKVLCSCGSLILGTGTRSRLGVISKFEVRV